MIRPCPTCGLEAPRLLEESSRDAVVNYYRCEHCGTVWNKPKNAEEPIKIVMRYPTTLTDTKS
jgi:uncharacterized Zn finger protein